MLGKLLGIVHGDMVKQGERGGRHGAAGAGFMHSR
jgi:hypothetical protein